MSFDLIKGDFFDYYPEDIKNSSDKDFRLLADYVNTYMRQLVDRYQGYGNDLSIEDLERLYQVEVVPKKMLPYLASMVGYDIDFSKTDREIQRDIFSWAHENKSYGTVEYLKRRITEITGVVPDIRTPSSDFVGWDQNGTIDGVPEAVNFAGGIGWDQTNEFEFSVFLIPFRWYVVRSGLLIDIKNDAVFDADPQVNADILDKVFKVVGRYKGSSIVAEVGYVDSMTGGDIILRWVYSKDIISPTVSPTLGSINNLDPGIEF